VTSLATLWHPERPALVATDLGELDALVVSDLSNLRWLSGFTGSAGLAVLDRDRLTLVVDGRYGEQARRQATACGVDADVVVGATQDALVQLLADLLGSRRVGFEAHATTVATHQRWAAASAAQLEPVTEVIERHRRRKGPAEIERIAEAARIADLALAECLDVIRPGATEAEVRNALEVRMRAHGASGPSYETIVATGPVNAALPHHRPTSTIIEPGHTVVIDVGALVDGYHSDMTRTFLVGTPSDEAQVWYDLVAAAQHAGLAAVRPGVPASAVDAACREVFAAAGVDQWFVHGTGHGVGLLIHEDPFLHRASHHQLQVGDVVTVEPGLYRGGLGGVRIEDLVVVTSDGHRNLTTSPKDAPCLPSPPTT
jgi:Xaa-Pro aminopeptidase